MRGPGSFHGLPLSHSPPQTLLYLLKKGLCDTRGSHLCKLWPHTLKWGQRRLKAMKKVLWSTATAALFALTLTGCADNAPIQTEDRPQATTEIPTESTAPVESEIILFFSR